MSKHTPGPWRVGGQGRIYCPEGWYVATVYESVYEGVNQANARLIAAAPELHEAIAEEDLSGALRDVAEAIRTKNWDILTGIGSRWFEAQAQGLDALIAKVRGD